MESYFLIIVFSFPLLLILLFVLSLVFPFKQEGKNDRRYKANDEINEEDEENEEE